VVVAVVGHLLAEGLVLAVLAVGALAALARGFLVHLERQILAAAAAARSMTSRAVMGDQASPLFGILILLLRQLLRLVHPQLQ
jgi:hypothetical protein